MPDLASAVTLQLTYLEQLKLSLESELHLISSRDAEALITLLQAKEQLLDQIRDQDELIAKEYQLVAQAGKLTADIDGLFEQAKELVSQCKYRTEINVKAVAQGQLRLEHLRHLLLESRAKESMTYDKSGKTRGPSSTKGTSA